MTDHEKAILYSLAYSDIFRFPLTKAELWQFLICETQISREDFERTLKHLQKNNYIILQKGLYVLPEHSSDIKKRLESTKILQKKKQLAMRAAYYLSYIPTILLIGISGSVAMGNASENDDIDIFIITKKHTLYVSRLWIQAVLEMLNLRRKRTATETKDTICVNLLIDENNMTWPLNGQDIYTAHEIIQMKPLFERHSTYQYFLKSNAWIEQFYPNAFADKPPIPGSHWKRSYLTLRLFSAFASASFFETIAKIGQSMYMKQHKTVETVNKGIMAFHPIDYRSKTLTSLNMKLRDLGLLTKK